MFRVVFYSVLSITFIWSVSGNIFTDPVKLRRLFECQMRLSKILSNIDDEELSELPKDVLIHLLR